jgi:hypothetical protein
MLARWRPPFLPRLTTEGIGLGAMGFAQVNRELLSEESFLSFSSGQLRCC